MIDERVVVVGAGLAGLAVAARLVLAKKQVLVLEASARAGGQIHSFVDGELVVELGAEGFVARSRAVPQLCALLGVEGSLVEQLTTDTYCLEDGRLLLLPPGEAARRLGFQVPEEELGRGIRSLSRGMGQLIDALVAGLGSEDLRLSVTALAIHRGAAGLEVELFGGRRERCSQLVLATPAKVARALLQPLNLACAESLATAPVTSNVSVNLLYRREQFAQYPAGSGLLFPESFAAQGLRALSLVDHKFAGRVPAERALLRVFFRPSAEALEGWSDDRFSSEAAQAIAQVLGAKGTPERSWVSRWVEALPVFSPAYRAQVAELDSALQALGVHLTGSAFHGAGIDAAVASASAVAARLAV